MVESNAAVFDGWASERRDHADSDDSDLELFGDDHAGDLSNRYADCTSADRTRRI